MKIVAIGILAGIGFASGQSPQLAPIPIALPKPLYEGTPRNLRIPNLEKPLGNPRPPFLAPAGTTNVARGKPVSSSTADPAVGDLEMVTNGDKSGVDGSFVELGPGVLLRLLRPTVRDAPAPALGPRRLVQGRRRASARLAGNLMARRTPLGRKI